MKNHPDVPKPSGAWESPNLVCSPAENASKSEKVGNSLSLSGNTYLNQDSDTSATNQARSSSFNTRNKYNMKIGLSYNSSSNSPSFQINNQMLSSAIRSSSRNNLPLTSKKISFPLGKHSVTPPRNSTDSPHLHEISPQNTDKCFGISEITDNKFVDANKDQVKNNALVVQDENACPISNDSNSTVFQQKENNIITQINEISKSIEELLKQRKEIQFQHKIWLDDRKKKIFQVRKETNQMQNDGKTISANMLLFPIITLVGPTDNSIQQS